MNVEALQTDQKGKTPVTNGPKTAPFFFRFGLDRSRDSQKSDQPGQDCISVQWTATRLSATLCDGVSQSFFGELAAAELSNKLSQFLLDLPNESNPIFLHDTIRAYLDTLSSTFSRAVEEHSIESVEPAFLRAVLEKKRSLGSEAVFSAVLLDKMIDRVLLVWAGDCRLRLWLHGEEVTRELLSTETFITRERWSSSKGVIGNLHLALYPFSSFDTIVSYSDGLAQIDDAPNIFQETNVAIEQYISQTKSLASSDDVSFLQISTLPADKLPQNIVAQLPALQVIEQESSDYVQFQWQNLPKVQYWEVVADSETGFAKLEASKNVVKVPIFEIPSDGAWLAYRAMSNNRSTPWSSWKFYQPPRSLNNTVTEISSQKTILLPPQPSQKGYTPLPGATSTRPAATNLLQTPTNNGSTDSTAYVRPTQTLPVGAPSDRRWQIALLALLMGIILLGTFLIFSSKQSELDRNLPPPQGTRIHNPEILYPPDATLIPPTKITSSTAVIETTTPTGIIDLYTPPASHNPELPGKSCGMNDPEFLFNFPVDDTYLGRLFFRSEVVSP